MRCRNYFCTFFTLSPLYIFLIVLLCGWPESAIGAEILSPQQSNELIQSQGAVLLDVRTVKEAKIVGSPADEAAGTPLGYTIPYELRLGRVATTENPFFVGAVEQALGDSRDVPVVVMCHTGRRATAAASQLESMGFAEVFIMDDPQDAGNVGGFGGTYTTSYRGWPVFLPTADVPQPDSATWLGSGLPITNSVDPARVFVYPIPFQ